MSCKKVVSIALITVLVAVVLSGCSSTKTTEKASGAKFIRYSVGVEPETLDPRKSTGMPESKIECQLFEGLTTYAQGDKIVPAAAEKWEISPDGLVYTFTLRSNLKWSNGDPLTAQDFEYSWKTTLSPELASKYADQLYYLKNSEAYNKGKGKAEDVGVKAKDDRTLVVTLHTPASFFPMVLAHHAYYPVHKKTVEANPKWATDFKGFVGNGPFVMTNWTHNSKIELAKNANYWDKAKVKMEKMELFLIDNNSTELSMFESGQLDMGDNPPRPEFDRLKKENKLVIFPYFGTYYMSFNVTKAPLDNPKVRKALSLAIDRETIVKNIAKGGEIPALAFVPPNAQDSKPGDDFRKVGGDYVKKNDLDTAKKLLAEAGYPDGKGLPPITIIYNTNELHKSVCEALQEMWKKNLGVNVTLANQEWKVFLNSRAKGDYQIARHGWIGDYLDAMTMLGLFVTNGGNNNLQYSNPKYDELIKIAQTSNDPNVRIKAMHDAEKLIVADDSALAPVYYYTQPSIMKPNLKGLVRSSLGQTYFKEAYLE